jgi:DUF4097 and DUF4098 domain-containing protein YvlB
MTTNGFNFRLSITVASIAVLWFCPQLMNGQSRSERIIVPLSDASRVPLVRVELVNGGITVQGGDRTNVIVEAHAHSNDSDASEGARLTADDLSVKQDNNQVSITSYTMKREINLTILVPRRSSLVLSAVNRGAILVTDVDGELEANNVNGAVTMRNISGNVIAHSLNAPVVVSFRNIDPQKPMAFSSMNGTIDVTFPPEIKANVSLQSGQGSVYSDFDIQLEQTGSQPITEEMQGGDARYRVKAAKTVHGTINGGGPELQFKNFNGCIYIHKAAA